MKHQSFVIKALLLLSIIVYLFVTAEPPLPEHQYSGRTIPIETVLRALESENDVVRTLYTKEIVGAGLKVGLAFDEDWRERAVHAGPLPALFLRETAIFLEKNPIRLGLFLGSDFPINASNRFEGIQTEKFETIKENGEPQFFYAEDTDLHTAMFPDHAVAEACVTCHNEHEQSPKNDWRLQDVMGATTWSYPKERVTMDEFVAILGALRDGFKNTYATYLAKVETFDQKPVIGDQWPRQGYYLPSVSTFMEEIRRRSAYDTLETLLNTESGVMVAKRHEAE